MKRRVVKVGDVLEQKGASVSSIKSEDTVGNLSRRLKQEQVGVMVVSDDGTTVAGIVSERDIAYGLAQHQGDLHTLPVSALMTRRVITCSPEDNIGEVIKVMSERRIRHLPVTADDKLVGVIGMRDIMLHRLVDMQRTTKLMGSFIMSDN